MGTSVVETFAALGDPVRSAIVDRLVSGDATVGELASQFTITLQAVSQQISTLERAGLVTRHREGRARRVHLEVASIEAASRWMELRRVRLEQRYQRLDQLLADELGADPKPTTTVSIEALVPEEPLPAAPASRKDRS